MSDVKPQAVKDSGSNTAAAGQTPTKSVKADKDTDSMLDIFTSEEFKEDHISVICKDLGDVSVHSLLEQTRQLAEQIRFGR
jgi:hypothetical protein